MKGPRLTRQTHHRHLRGSRFISVGTAVSYLFLVTFAIAVLFPIVWLVGASFNPGSALYSIRIFPRQLTFEHYSSLFKEGALYTRWYLNTLKVACVNCLLSLLFTTLTAYSFSRHRFPGRRTAMMIFLIIQMYPGILGMVALYTLLAMFGLLDSHWGLVLVYSASQIPFNTWLIKGYLDGIPRELDEAAQIDGAGYIVRLFRVILPVARPVISVVGLFNFFGPFFDYVFPRILLRAPEKWTLGVGLWNIVMGRTLYSSINNFNEFTAGALLVAFPCAVVYLLCQKNLITGLARGTTR